MTAAAVAYRCAACGTVEALVLDGARIVACTSRPDGTRWACECRTGIDGPDPADLCEHAGGGGAR